MSLRMISDVLKPKDVATHCPLCGRAFSRFPSTEEHIFPQWLQHHHDLWNRRLTIPNFIGKTYKTVKIGICERCNGKTFGKLESQLAPLFTGSDPYAEATCVDSDTLAIWLGKIFWLLIRKSHSVVDFRTRDLPEPERIIPDALLPGTLFLGMIERCFATRKDIASCYATDPPFPEFFYGRPYSLYRFRIDTRDSRRETFDFADNPFVLGVAMRSHNLGLICLFDGGVHYRFRSWDYAYLADEALHPVQFSEVIARMMYEQTLLHEDATRVTYYWNKLLNSVIAQLHTSRNFLPYEQERHDPALLAEFIGRHTAQDPGQILQPDGAVFTCLHDKEQNFLRFAVTEEELAAARADPNQIIIGPADAKWRMPRGGA